MCIVTKKANIELKGPFRKNSVYFIHFPKSFKMPKIPTFCVESRDFFRLKICLFSQSAQVLALSSEGGPVRWTSE